MPRYVVFGTHGSTSPDAGRATTPHRATGGYASRNTKLHDSPLLENFYGTAPQQGIRGKHVYLVLTALQRPDLKRKVSEGGNATEGFLTGSGRFSEDSLSPEPTFWIHEANESWI